MRKAGHDGRTAYFSRAIMLPTMLAGNAFSKAKRPTTSSETA
jgi:hypothetical protein